MRELLRLVVKAGTGTAQAAQYDIAGSGDIDAGALDAKDLKATIAGSGGIKAHSSGTADVSIMGSGDVDVAGGAKCKVSKAGSGPFGTDPFLAAFVKALGRPKLEPSGPSVSSVTSVANSPRPSPQRHRPTDAGGRLKRQFAEILHLHGMANRKVEVRDAVVGLQHRG